MSEIRDPREITVAGEMRSARPVKTARRPASCPAAAGPSEGRVMLGAVASGTFRMCRRNPGTLLGGGVALAAVVMVSMNALGYQNGRHPAPILPKIAIRQDAVRKDPPQKAAPEKVAEAERMPARSVEPAKPAARDPIADLIRSEDTTASVTPKASVSPKAFVSPKASSASKAAGAVPKGPDAALKPQPAVMQAQKALSKLGYGALKADGVMGATTRAAIEKFERDRKLPVKGEAAGRTLRELAARAALPPA